MQIIPAAPTSSSVITLRFTGSGCGPSADVAVSGRTLTVTQTVDCLCFSAAPPYTLEVSAGPLAAGDYAVVLRTGTYTPGEPSCPLTITDTQTSVLQVSAASAGQAPATVPSGSTGSVLVLVLLVTALAVRAGAGARHTG